MTPSTHRSGEGGWGAARADLQARAWAVEELAGSPARIHAAGIPDPSRRLIRWCVPDRPALVLGSAQPEADVDRDGAAAAGLEVVRRRSGGSAVVVGPGRLVWADVILPAADPLWSDDVGIAPVWLGRCWAEALASVGVTDPVVHEGAMVRGRWGSLVCFAGIGPGEVLVGGRKLVGISQRRTRAAALFQAAVLLRWDPAETVAGLAADPGAAADLADVAVGLADLTPEHRGLADAFIAAVAAAQGPRAATTR